MVLLHSVNCEHQDCSPVKIKTSWLLALFNKKNPEEERQKHCDKVLKPNYRNVSAFSLSKI